MAGGKVGRKMELNGAEVTSLLKRAGIKGINVETQAARGQMPEDRCGEVSAPAAGLSAGTEYGINISIENALAKYTITVSRAGRTAPADAALGGDDAGPLLVDPLTGLRRYEILNYVKRIGFSPSQFRFAVDVIYKLFELYCRIDATEIEAGRLIPDPQGGLALADCKIFLDDDAGYRQRDLQRHVIPPENELEKRGREEGITYVELDGEIAVLSGGAGSTMAVVDLIHHFGGRAANFIDTMGGAGKDTLKNLIDIVLTKARRSKRVKVILITMHLTATPLQPIVELLLSMLKPESVPAPVVAFFQATGIAAVNFAPQAAMDLFKARGVEVFSNLKDAILRSVDLAKARHLKT